MPSESRLHLKWRARLGLRAVALRVYAPTYGHLRLVVTRNRHGNNTVEDTIAEGDHVVICWTMTGTHNSAFMGIAPTGKRFAVRGVSTARLEGDTIVRIDLYWDRLAMVEQLGASLNAN